MNLSIHTEKEKVLVTLEGRLDTTNTSDFEKEIAPLLSMHAPHITIDCKELSYISSSGLRVFLLLLKKVSANQGLLVLKNLRSEVREIFDMTGLSSIFTIE